MSDVYFTNFRSYGKDERFNKIRVPFARGWTRKITLKISMLLLKFILANQVIFLICVLTTVK